jgi:hypothetical protein
MSQSQSLFHCSLSPKQHVCAMWRPVFKAFSLLHDRGKFRISDSHSATPDAIATPSFPASGIYSAQSHK